MLTASPFSLSLSCKWSLSSNFLFDNLNNSLLKDCACSAQGGENAELLVVVTNDMGDYGCYWDCAEIRSMPLLAKAIVNLIRRKLMSALFAYSR